MAKRPKTLQPVRANAGFEALYRKRLESFLRGMSDDIERQVVALYAGKPPEMATDDTPVAALRALLTRLSRKWQARSNTMAQELSDYFAKGVAQRSDAALKSILRRGGFTVSFQMTREVSDVIQAIIGENVSLIKSIASQHLSEVEGVVMRSVSAGCDLKLLTDDLQSRFDITRRRAVFVARDQSNKATSAIARSRQTSLGITEGIWRHSRGGNHPRKDHVRFSGQRFNLKEGHDFGDRCKSAGSPETRRCARPAD